MHEQEQGLLSGIETVVKEQLRRCVPAALGAAAAAKGAKSNDALARAPRAPAGVRRASPRQAAQDQAVRSVLRRLDLLVAFTGVLALRAAIDIVAMIVRPVMVCAAVAAALWLLLRRGGGGGQPRLQ